RLGHIKVAFVIGGLAYYGLWRLMYPLSAAWSPRLDNDPATLAFTGVAMFPGSALQLLAFTGILVFLPFYLNSLLLPWVCNRLQASRRHLGIAYGLNTLAFCLGLIGFTLLAPLVSVFYSLKLMLVLLACGAGLLLVLSEQRPTPVGLPAGFAALFVAGCVMVPRDFDAAYMRPGTDPARRPVEYVMSDGASTTFVVRSPGDDRLYFGNLSMSGTGILAQAYMRLMAHVPLLAQENPTRALLICFGVGNTASAIAAHDSVRHIDIVDLNRNVFLTAPAFAATNGNVQRDPRVRLIHDDGRNFLRHADQTYDLITSEPPPPMAAGVYRLYSREYYEDARARLSPTGLMSQWLPIYQMPLPAVEMAIATFVEVFPNAILYVGLQNELLLIGGPGDLDLARVVRRFGSLPAARADLAAIGVNDATDLVARIMMTDTTLRRRYTASPRISDRHNPLDQLYLTPRNLAWLPYDPRAVADELDERWPALGAGVRPLITHLGRLRYRVDSFPLQQVRADPAVALSGVDWRQIAVIQKAAGALDSRGDLAGAIALVEDALRAAPEPPALISWLADRLVAAGRASDALPWLQIFVELEPRDPQARWQMANALYAAGRGSEAIPHLEQAIARRPGWLSPLTNLA
ncbi:MAG: hypothetical protein KJ041_10080, partial [Gammaproteobacteria bacterium]|nr:hypothetical protein [Gammaproteobacteria bacterium]